MLQMLEANVLAHSVDGIMSVAAHKSLVFTGCIALRVQLLKVCVCVCACV